MYSILFAIILSLCCITPSCAQCNTTCYIDNDSDGQGNCTVFRTNQCSCAVIFPGKWVDTCEDCDDSNSLKLSIPCYLDYDQDNYGNNTVNQTICAANPFACYSLTPGHWAGLPNDCNDFDRNIQGPRYACCRDADCDGVGAGPALPSCLDCNQLPYPASRVCYDYNDTNPNYIADECCRDSGNGKGYADTRQLVGEGCSSLIGYVSNCDACNGTSAQSVTCCIDSVSDRKGSAVSVLHSCHGCSDIVPGSWLRDCSVRRNCSSYVPPTSGVLESVPSQSDPSQDRPNIIVWLIVVLLSFILRL